MKKKWKGKLVKHKNGKLGLVVKANRLHPNYLKVMTMGKLEEWHILSIANDS